MANEPHILVVDDDQEIRDLVARFLKRHGFRVDAAADVAEMFRMLDGGRFDLVVLDLMLPGEDGLSLCRRVRTDSNLPIIMLTAMGEEADRVIGLEMGADDYLAKPFGPRELLARIRSVLRRAAREPGEPVGGGRTVLTFAGFTLDFARRELFRPEGALLPLTDGEFDLLAAFAEHPKRILNRDQLLDLTKGRAAIPFDRSVDVQLSRLRRKIEPDPKNPEFIKTVRGGGYIFTCEVAPK
jgi:two-component system OmpR family response regulator